MTRRTRSPATATAGVVAEDVRGRGKTGPIMDMHVFRLADLPWLSPPGLAAPPGCFHHCGDFPASPRVRHPCGAPYGSRSLPRPNGPGRKEPRETCRWWWLPTATTIAVRRETRCRGDWAAIRQPAVTAASTSFAVPASRDRGPRRRETGGFARLGAAWQRTQPSAGPPSQCTQAPPADQGACRGQRGVRACDLLRMFGREGHPAPLGQAFAEYGRIRKTEHLMRMVDPIDDTYRRQMNRQPPCRSPPPQARPRRVPRQARHHPPGIPRRHGGPTRRPRPGPQRRRAVDDAAGRCPPHGVRGPQPGLSPLKPQPEPARPIQLHRQRLSRRRPLRDPNAPELDEDEDESVGSE